MGDTVRIKWIVQVDLITNGGTAKTVTYVSSSRDLDDAAIEALALARADHPEAVLRRVETFEPSFKSIQPRGTL